VKKSTDRKKGRLTIQFNDPTRRAGRGRRGEGLADDEAVGLGQQRQHRTVLDVEGRRDESLRGLRETRAQVIGALIVGREIPPEQCGLRRHLGFGTAKLAPDQRRQEQKTAPPLSPRSLHVEKAGRDLHKREAVAMTTFPATLRFPPHPHRIRHISDTMRTKRFNR
jgi:hypothetical protein